MGNVSMSFLPLSSFSFSFCGRVRGAVGNYKIQTEILDPSVRLTPIHKRCCLLCQRSNSCSNVGEEFRKQNAYSGSGGGFLTGGKGVRDGFGFVLYMCADISSYLSGELCGIVDTGTTVDDVHLVVQ